MPQEIISIQHFGGMVTNPHKEDIPDNMAVYALNVDPQAEFGTLKGIKQNGASYTANGSAIPDVYEADWINYEVSGIPGWDLIYIDTNADDITAVENFYGAEAARTLTDLVTSGIEPRCVRTFSNQVQIGNGNYQPRSVYRLLEDKVFFGGAGEQTVTAGLQVEYGRCYNPSSGDGSFLVSAGTENAGAGYFQSGIAYAWKVSLVYDGLQESNLGTIFSDVASATSDYYTLTIKATGLYPTNIDLLDSRVTAVKLYRAESSDGQVGNLGLYRLVKIFNIGSGDNPPNISGTANAAVTTGATFLKDTRLDLLPDEYVGATVTCQGKTLVVTTNDLNTFTGTSWSGGTPASGNSWTCRFPGWNGAGSDYTLTYDDDGSFPDGGATYEEETGMPENLEYQYIKYALNEVGGGYHWVANGEPEGESDIDWSRYIFRSKKFRPNMFDWTRDFLVLPEIPTALAWYNDRLYAFSNNTVYRINPELMYIEDTFFGAGASHRQSVLVSEYGLYFCNLNGAYRIKDSGIEVISDPISETTTEGVYPGWKSFAAASANSAFGRITIKAEADKRLILFVGSTATVDNKSNCFGFYIPTEQWYRFGLGVIDLTANSGLFGGKDGEVYISNGTASYRLFNSANYENTVWVSKEFHLGEPSQNKSWNKIKWDATTPTGSSVTVTYGTEGTDPATSATNDAWINIYKKTFQVKIAGTAATVNNPKVDSLDIIVRRLFGKR